MAKATAEEIGQLKTAAAELRRDIVRMLAEAGSGHPGGSLSAAEIVACLYFREMKYDAGNPNWPERDRFVLSKGHAAPLLYAALARAGFFQRDLLWTLRQLGSPLQGHPDMRKLPGVEACTGSLGQGMGWAVGMALAQKMDGRAARTYVLLGDGEIQEGLVWEGAMAAAQFRLDNLTAFIDHNGLQIDGPVNQIMSPEPVGDKFRAFGWHVAEIDGNQAEQILQALDEARQAKGRPTAIVARTVKGRGVSFMENNVDWHGKAPKPEEAERALAELG